MVELKVSSVTSSNLSTDPYKSTIYSLNTDGVTGQDDNTYQNTNWSKQWGYFNSIPELKNAILMKAVWNVGKGYECDDATKVMLDNIKGWGKDTFDDILFNLEVTKRVGGDAYAEIVWAEDGLTVLNLKMLDPSTIKIHVDKYGIIKHYEQVGKISGKSKIIQVEDMLHLSNNRLADQIHGISDIDVLMENVLASQQVFDDMKKLTRNQARPLIMFKLKTNDLAQVEAFKTKMDAAMQKGENMYIPDDENTLSFEVIQVNPSQILLEWKNDLRNGFYRGIGLPQIVPGGGGQSTESESKVIYLAFENIVEHSQRQLEQQLWNQLYIHIDLVPPTTLQAEMAQDTSKDGASQQLNFQPSDLQANAGR